MTVGQFCNREVVVTSKNSTILEVARLMRQHHVGDVVVVADGQSAQPVPLGIITDRDIVVELIAAEVDLDTVTVGDVMSFEITTVKEQDGIWETVQRMRAKGIRRVPVVNDKGGLEGILTADDLLELFSEELMQLARVADSEISREKTLRS